MNHYEVIFTIYGIFPEKITPRLTKQISLVRKLDNAHSIISITLGAENHVEALHSAYQQLEEFLSFYSVVTINHFRIIITKENPVKIIELPGNKKTDEYGADYSIIIPTEALTDIVMPLYTITQNDGNEYLRIAMQQLFRARYEELSQFVILDCMVALESLFSKSGESTEISYKISNRVATLLADNKNERIQLARLFKNFYNIRSRVIHGDYVEVKADAFGDILVWVKKAILMFLELAKELNHDEIIEKIDEAMIDNELLAELRNKPFIRAKEIDMEQHRQLLKRIKDESNPSPKN